MLEAVPTVIYIPMLHAADPVTIAGAVEFCNVTFGYPPPPGAPTPCPGGGRKDPLRRPHRIGPASAGTSAPIHPEPRPPPPGSTPATASAPKSPRTSSAVSLATLPSVLSTTPLSRAVLNRTDHVLPTTDISSVADNQPHNMLSNSGRCAIWSVIRHLPKTKEGYGRWQRSCPLLPRDALELGDRGGSQNRRPARWARERRSAGESPRLT